MEKPEEAVERLEEIYEELKDLSIEAGDLLMEHFPEIYGRAEPYDAVMFGSSSNPHFMTFRIACEDARNELDDLELHGPAHGPDYDDMPEEPEPPHTPESQARVAEMNKNMEAIKIVKYIS